MKIEVYEDDYIVYLNKDKIKNIDFKIKKQVESCFREVFSKIKKRLDKDINGLFSINVYLNDSFGAILNIEKENIEYYDYFSNQIDMQIEIEYDAKILLEFDDIFNIKCNNNIRRYNKKYYIEYDDDIRYVEFSNVIYGLKVNNILKKGIIINNVCDM